MAELIRNWIVNLVVVILLSVLVDIILPNGSMRKYAKFVLGIMIIFVVMSPIIAAFQKGFQLEEEIFHHTHVLDMDDLKYQAQTIEDKYQDTILNLYKKKLEQQIMYQVRKEAKTAGIEAVVSIIEDKNSESYGAIKKVILRTEGRGKTGDYEDVHVDANHSTSMTEIKEGGNPNIDYSRIREMISSTYQISPEDIIID
ncbi:MAG: stage III sporulation protein AF [Clostridia bacterium]|jgi:stage III sporulation protein AF